jgi:hypothetical protein
MCALPVYLFIAAHRYLYPPNLFLAEQCVSGLGLSQVFPSVVLDRLENLARAAGGVLDWLENLARAAGGVWIDSKIWHRLLVASWTESKIWH